MPCSPILKKTAPNRRVSPPRATDYAKDFFRDWERLERSGRYNIASLKSVMLQLIANEGPLEAEWLDHPLKGKWTSYRECHIGGNFLLVYQADSKSITLVRTGTHSELFDH